MLTRIEGMPEQPYTCTLCGQGPTDNSGNIKESIFAEGVDIDWGNSLYICMECAGIIADLAGRATREGFDHLQEKYDELLAKHQELLEEHERQEELLDKIRDGSAAQKKIRERATA